jgi:hypothetical protein
MNDTRKIPQKSSIFPENPYNTTGLSGNIITSPIEAYISRITVNFGKISQNDANFAARVSFLTAQKNQKKPKNRSFYY